MTGSALREIFTLANEFRADDRLVGGTADDRVCDETRRAPTIAQLKAILLGTGAPAWARAHRGALASEAIAAVVKVMTTDELSAVACRLFNQSDGDAADDGGHQRVKRKVRRLSLAQFSDDRVVDGWTDVFDGFVRARRVHAIR
jgi:hypothetical protein